MGTTDINPTVRYILSKCPTAGSGVHEWLFVASLELNYLVPDDQQLADLLADATSNCGREVPAREIEGAIRSARRCAQNPTQISRPRWSGRDDAQIRAILRDGPSLAQLEN